MDARIRLFTWLVAAYVAQGKPLTDAQDFYSTFFGPVPAKTVDPEVIILPVPGTGNIMTAYEPWQDELPDLVNFNSKKEKDGLVTDKNTRKEVPTVTPVNQESITTVTTSTSVPIMTSKSLAPFSPKEDFTSVNTEDQQVTAQTERVPQERSEVSIKQIKQVPHFLYSVHSIPKERKKEEGVTKSKETVTKQKSETRKKKIIETEGDTGKIKQKMAKKEGETESIQKIPLIDQEIASQQEMPPIKQEIKQEVNVEDSLSPWERQAEDNKLEDTWERHEGDNKLEVLPTKWPSTVQQAATKQQTILNQTEIPTQYQETIKNGQNTEDSFKPDERQEENDKTEVPPIERTTTVQQETTAQKQQTTLKQETKQEINMKDSLSLWERPAEDDKLEDTWERHEGDDKLEVLPIKWPSTVQQAAPKQQTILNQIERSTQHQETIKKRQNTKDSFKPGERQEENDKTEVPPVERTITVQQETTAPKQQTPLKQEKKQEINMKDSLSLWERQAEDDKLEDTSGKHEGDDKLEVLPIKWPSTVQQEAPKQQTILNQTERSTQYQEAIKKRQNNEDSFKPEERQEESNKTEIPPIEQATTVQLGKIVPKQQIFQKKIETTSQYREITEQEQNNEDSFKPWERQEAYDKLKVDDKPEVPLIKHATTKQQEITISKQQIPLKQTEITTQYKELLKIVEPIRQKQKTEDFLMPLQKEKDNDKSRVTPIQQTTTQYKDLAQQKPNIENSIKELTIQEGNGKQEMPLIQEASTVEREVPAPIHQISPKQIEINTQYKELSKQKQNTEDPLNSWGKQNGDEKLEVPPIRQVNTVQKELTSSKEQISSQYNDLYKIKESKIQKYNTKDYSNLSDKQEKDKTPKVPPVQQVTQVQWAPTATIEQISPKQTEMTTQYKESNKINEPLEHKQKTQDILMTLEKEEDNDKSKVSPIQQTTIQYNNLVQQKPNIENSIKPLNIQEGNVKQELQLIQEAATVEEEVPVLTHQISPKQIEINTQNKKLSKQKQNIEDPLILWERQKVDEKPEVPPIKQVNTVQQGSTLSKEQIPTQYNDINKLKESKMQKYNTEDSSNLSDKQEKDKTPKVLPIQQVTEEQWIPTATKEQVSPKQIEMTTQYKESIKIKEPIKEKQNTEISFKPWEKPKVITQFSPDSLQGRKETTSKNQETKQQKGITNSPLEYQITKKEKLIAKPYFTDAAVAQNPKGVKSDIIQKEVKNYSVEDHITRSETNFQHNHNTVPANKTVSLSAAKGDDLVKIQEAAITTTDDKQNILYSTDNLLPNSVKSETIPEEIAIVSDNEKYSKVKQQTEVPFKHWEKKLSHKYNDPAVYMNDIQKDQITVSDIIPIHDKEHTSQVQPVFQQELKSSTQKYFLPGHISPQNKPVLHPNGTSKPWEVTTLPLKGVESEAIQEEAIILPEQKHIQNENQKSQNLIKPPKPSHNHADETADLQKYNDIAKAENQNILLDEKINSSNKQTEVIKSVTIPEDIIITPEQLQVSNGVSIKPREIESLHEHIDQKELIHPDFQKDQVTEGLTDVEKYTDAVKQKNKPSKKVLLLPSTITELDTIPADTTIFGEQLQDSTEGQWEGSTLKPWETESSKEFIKNRIITSGTQPSLIDKPLEIKTLSPKQIESITVKEQAINMIEQDGIPNEEQLSQDLFKPWETSYEGIDQPYHNHSTSYHPSESTKIESKGEINFATHQDADFLRDQVTQQTESFSIKEEVPEFQQDLGISVGKETDVLTDQVTFKNQLEFQRDLEVSTLKNWEQDESVNIWDGITDTPEGESNMSKPKTFLDFYEKVHSQNKTVLVNKETTTYQPKTFLNFYDKFHSQNGLVLNTEEPITNGPKTFIDFYDKVHSQNESLLVNENAKIQQPKSFLDFYEKFHSENETQPKTYLDFYKKYHSKNESDSKQIKQEKIIPQKTENVLRENENIPHMAQIEITTLHKELTKINNPIKQELNSNVHLKLWERQEDDDKLEVPPVKQMQYAETSFKPWQTKEKGDRSDEQLIQEVTTTQPEINAPKMQISLKQIETTTQYKEFIEKMEPTKLKQNIEASFKPWEKQGGNKVLPEEQVTTVESKIIASKQQISSELTEISTYYKELIDKKEPTMQTQFTVDSVKPWEIQKRNNKPEIQSIKKATTVQQEVFPEQIESTIEYKESNEIKEPIKLKQSTAYSFKPWERYKENDKPEVPSIQQITTSQPEIIVSKQQISPVQTETTTQYKESIENKEATKLKQNTQDSFKPSEIQVGDNKLELQATTIQQKIKTIKQQLSPKQIESTTEQKELIEKKESTKLTQNRVTSFKPWQKHEGYYKTEVLPTPTQQVTTGQSEISPPKQTKILKHTETTTQYKESVKMKKPIGQEQNTETSFKLWKKQGGNELSYQQGETKIDNTGKRKQQEELVSHEMEKRIKQDKITSNIVNGTPKLDDQLKKIVHEATKELNNNTENDQKVEYATPQDKSITLQQKYTTVQKKDITLPQKYTTPQNLYTTTDQKYITTSKEDITPLPKYITPQLKYITPQQSYTMQQQKYTTKQMIYTTPQDKYLSPEQKHTIPWEKFITLQKIYTIPQEEPTTPQKIYTYTQQKYTTPTKIYTTTQQSYAINGETTTAENKNNIQMLDHNYNQERSKSNPKIKKIWKVQDENSNNMQHNFRGDAIKPDIHNTKVEIDVKNNKEKVADINKVSTGWKNSTNNQQIITQPPAFVTTTKFEKANGNSYHIVSGPEIGSENTSKIFSSTVTNVQNITNDNETYILNLATSECPKNEIYVLSKDKMVLVSSNKVARDISGIRNFEENLLDQIKNQDDIIKTLKARVKSLEDQNEKLYIVQKLEKANTISRMQELEETRDLLDFAREKIKEIETNGLNEAEYLSEAKQENGDLKMEIAAMNNNISQLNYQLTVVDAIKIRNLKRDLELCNKAEMVSRTYKQEESEDLCSERVQEDYSGLAQTLVLKSQVEDQNTAVHLLKEHIQTQARTLISLDTIIMRKDEIVQRLQKQVHALIDNKEKESLVCGEKDELIALQSIALINLKNMTVMQDQYSQSKDIALKILQNTVYHMVDSIPQCKEVAVKGLRSEIKALNNIEEPMKKIIATMKTSLEAIKSAINIAQTGEQEQMYQKLIIEQNKTLETCFLQTENQALALKIKFSKAPHLDGENMNDCIYTSRTCSRFCLANKTTVSLNNSKEEAEKSKPNLDVDGLMDTVRRELKSEFVVKDGHERQHKPGINDTVTNGHVRRRREFG